MLFRASWADGGGVAAVSRRRGRGRGRGGRTGAAACSWPMVLTPIVDSTVDSVEGFDSWSRFHRLFVSGLTVVTLGCWSATTSAGRGSSLSILCFWSKYEVTERAKIDF